MSTPATSNGTNNGEAPAHQPYVPESMTLKEFTFQAVVTGTALGLIFAASSLYLVLKIGMTVSASIPVAVLAITLFRAVARMRGKPPATILENNITQTAGSAGESIAFGVGVTMPTLMLLGFNMDLSRVMVVSILGGLLGILAMIPLRRAFIVKMHGRPGQPGTLLYPEGTACAQVLISGEKGGTTGKTVFIGFGIAFFHKFLTEGMAVLKETVRLPVTFINKAAEFSSAMASELLGVGYIIGIRTASMMMAGAILGYLVIIPLIFFIGEHSTEIIKPGKKPITEMGISELRNSYLLFIGAGCVASAGIISMLKTLPMIVRGIRSSLASIGGGAGDGTVKRTDNDMSMRVVLFGSAGLIVLLAMFLSAEVSVVSALLGALLVVLFGYLFVTVSSRLTGEIGSSSNPISGMTTATLMLTCLIFVALGMTSPTDRVLALSIAAVVCVASSNGGTTAQSLKTGYLVGGTPKLMQYAILIGALVSALVIGGTLLVINESKAVYSQKPQNVPDLTLTKDEMARLKQRQTYEKVEYLVFDTRNEELTKEDPNANYKPREEITDVKEGRYLVDAETGKLRYYVDYTIMGKLDQKDDGTPVTREFEAPKTQVMGIVITGVLGGDLNWTMVGLGAMIAIMLELCGVSALAFAVGVYVPIQYSVPIFLGGIVRWLIDKKLAKESDAEMAAAGNDPEKRALAEVNAIRRSETSGGVLMASGFIAGGSIAGVLITFLNFNPTLVDDLKSFEHGSTPLGKEMTLDQAVKESAEKQLGFNGSALAKKKKEELTPAEKTQLEQWKEAVGEYEDINSSLPAIWTKVPKGTVLRVQGIETYKLDHDRTLLDVSLELFQDPEMAAVLSDMNTMRLLEYPPIEFLPFAITRKPLANDFLLIMEGLRIIPAGVEIRVPKRYVVSEDRYLSDIARETLGRARKAVQLAKSNESALFLARKVNKGTILKLDGIASFSPATDVTLADVAEEVLGDKEEAKTLADLNANIFEPIDSVMSIAPLFKMEADVGKRPIQAGAAILVPKTYRAKTDTTLGEIARETYGLDRRAKDIYDLNQDKLELVLPAKAEFKRPQPTWPALLGFGTLIVILWLVGTGRWLKGPEEELSASMANEFSAGPSANSRSNP